jgi:hypothetical protein
MANDRIYNNNSDSKNGSLNIYIENAISMTYNEIEDKLGWNNNLQSDLSSYMSESEIEILTILNKIRHNPSYFAKQYLSHLIGDSKSYKVIYEKLISCSFMNTFNSNKNLQKVAKEHAVDLGENGITGGLSSSGLDLKARLAKHSGKMSTSAESIIYGYSDPLRIVIELLVDTNCKKKTNRYNILNDKLSEIGISMYKHMVYGDVVVIVFSK